MEVYLDKKVDKFLRGLNLIDRAVIDEHVKLLEEYSFELTPPVLKKISGHELWELRPRKIRLLFGKIKGGCIVVVGFRKTTKKTPQKYIKLALGRLKLWQKKQMD